MIDNKLLFLDPQCIIERSCRALISPWLFGIFINLQFLALSTSTGSIRLMHVGCPKIGIFIMAR